MAKDKKSVLVYVDWISTFEELDDEEAGKLIKHFFRYVNDLNPEPPDRVTKLVFEPIKQSLKRDLVKYESIRQKNKENADKRWQNNNATASDRMKENANHADSVSVSDSDSDSVNDIDINIKKKVVKVKFSDFVSFTSEEHQKLLDEFGEKDTIELITILNNYKGAKGKKYKSDYLAIRNWVVDRMIENKQKSNGQTFKTTPGGKLTGTYKAAEEFAREIEAKN